MMPSRFRTRSLHDALPILDLDADIRDYLPVDDQRAVPEPVTGRHLLTHHSGIVESLLFHPEPIDEPRSEEHTSELQSRGQLVCSLLIEKKKIAGGDHGIVA